MPGPLWVPARDGDWAALRARAGVTHLLLTSAGVSDPELDERWRDIFYSRRAIPPAWKELSTEPIGSSLALFGLGD